MSKVCPRCGCLDIEKEPDDWYNEDLVTCMRCAMIFPRAELADATIFQYIIQSPEVLAEKLVYTSYIKKKLPLTDMRGWLIGYKSVLRQVWKSSVTDEIYSKKSEAIAATLARLKEVYNADES